MERSSAAPAHHDLVREIHLRPFTIFSRSLNFAAASMHNCIYHICTKCGLWHYLPKGWATMILLRNFRKFALAKSLCAAVLMAAVPMVAGAQQAKPELAGSYANWDAYRLEAKSGLVCYISSQPTKTTASRKNITRGPIYFLVTFRPKENVRNEVSVLTGYPYKRDSTVSAKIDQTAFVLYTNGESAWIDGKTDENKLVLALKKGSKLVVTGTSARGTKTTDTYSLDGVTAALEELSKFCK